jgi:hypothetical protein
MAESKAYKWRDHWRLFLATGVMILSPFQYGIDFGMIGGLQAMVPFLQVSCSSNSTNMLDANTIQDLRIQVRKQEGLPNRMEHSP